MNTIQASFNVRRFLLLGGFYITAAFLIGCAAGDPRYTAETPAGFWTGVWHGMISWIMLIVGIFSDTAKVYEINNTGGWYDFGFLFGICVLWGGARQSGKRRFKRNFEIHFNDEFKERCRQWAKDDNDQSWEDICIKVEAKLKPKKKKKEEEPKNKK